MAAEDIGALVVRLEANLKNFETNLDKAGQKLTDFDKKADSMSSRVSAGFGKIVKGAIALGAAVGIKRFFDSTIQDAAEAEANLKQLDAVLKSTGGAAGVTKEQVTGLAASLQKVTKFSDDQTIAGENLLLTFTKIGKDVFPDATETMLDMSQALGQDVKSSAIQLGKALNDPILGVTALRRVGVNFTEAQKDQIKVMVESGDVMGAQKLILAELKTEFGGSAKAAGEGAGAFERLKNQFGEIKEQIGGYILPALSKMAEWFIGKMPDIQDAVETTFKVIGTTVKTTSAAINDLTGFFEKHWGVIEPILAGIAGGAATFGLYTLAINAATIATGIWTTVTGIATVVGTAFAAVLAFITSPIGLIVIAIAALVAAGVALYKNWDTVSAFLANIWQTISDTALNIWNGITAFFTQTVPQGFKAFVDFFASLPDRIQQFLYDLFFVKIPYAIGYGIGFMITAVSEGIPKLIKFFEELPGNIFRWLLEVINKFIVWRASIIAKAIEIGSAVFNSIINFIKKLPENIYTWLIAILPKLATFAVKVGSAAADIGKSIFNGIVDFVKSIPGEVTELLGNIVNTITKVARNIKNAISSIFKSGNEGIEAGQQAAKNRTSIRGYASGVTNFAGGMALVGERGPELVNLPRGSDVIPAGQTQQMLSGGDVIVQNMYVRNDNDIKLVARELNNLQQQRGRGLGVVTA